MQEHIVWLVPTLLLFSLLLLARYGFKKGLIKVDGKISLTEEIIIRVPVLAVLTAKPELATPMYLTADHLQRGIAARAIVIPIDVQTSLDQQVHLLNLTGTLQRALTTTIELITEMVLSRINIPELTEQQKVYVIYGVLNIIKQTAATRL